MEQEVNLMMNYLISFIKENQKYMSRLRQYISESNGNAVNITDTLMKDCKPFLKEWKGINNLLYRGSKKSVATISKIVVRTVRKPRDIPQEIHDKLNTSFVTKFGWKVRNGIFATGNPSVAKKYGEPYIFFPIGKYDYVWSHDIYDLYTELQDIEYDKAEFEDTNLYDNAKYEYEYEYEEENGTRGYYGKKDDANFTEYDDDSKDDVEWIPDMTQEEFIDNKKEEWETGKNAMIHRISGNYQDKDLKGAVRSRNEISFNCKEYYLINGTLELDLIKSLKKL